MTRVFLLILAAAVGLGGTLPARALYHCSMSGRRNLLRCCCGVEAEDGAMCSGCPTQEKAAPAASEPSGPEDPSPPEGGYALVGRVKGRCCTITYERGGRALAASASAAGAWKQTLDAARLAAVPPAVLADLRQDSADGSPASPRARGSPGIPVPLYILHRILLI